jgi:hypothetical protein
LIDDLFAPLGDGSAYLKFRKKRGIFRRHRRLILETRENPFPDRPESIDGRADFGGHAILLHMH